MKIVQQTIASLGSPMWIEPLGMPDRSAAVIARWSITWPSDLRESSGR